MKAALSERSINWKQIEELLTDKDMPYFIHIFDEKDNTCLHYLVKKISNYSAQFTKKPYLAHLERKTH
jgi:hypothetical protein